MNCAMKASPARLARWTSSVILTAALALVPSSPSTAATPHPSPQNADDITLIETITVTATRSERAVKDTPGQVDVVDAEEIEKLGYTNVSDLVRYLPGIYVDGDLTRLGSNGFNIRGIGGNRVQTRIDGIPTAEQFDFGPFGVPQYILDLDTLERVEIVRSAGSALYGSDALGGVVSLTTRSALSYLDGGPYYLGLRGGYDGRADEISETVTFAAGNEAFSTGDWHGLLLYSHRDGHEVDNQGSVDSADFTRTRPNPIDRQQDNILAKLGHSLTPSNQVEVSLEWFEGSTDTDVLSSLAPAQGAAMPDAILDLRADDHQERWRGSAEQSLVLRSTLADSLLWRAYAQRSDTEQVTDELRERDNVAVSTPGLAQLRRDGLLTFEQDTLGLDLDLRKDLRGDGLQVLTYGLSVQRDSFDQLRDRTEVLVATGEVIPQSLALPSKYFPQTDVEELGVFVQGEFDLWRGRLKLIPGLRFDRYDLDADQQDEVYLSGNPGTPAPVDYVEEAVSPRLGAVLAVTERVSVFAQYARGFRAPPMSSINNGFTNQAGGYRTLPNANLRPETSDNYELGLRMAFDTGRRRGSLSLTAFDNRYQDFIETVFLGFNPQLFLVEFQPQNLQDVRIRGLEFAAQADLGRGWHLRGAYTWIEGDDELLDQPLESIAPPTLVAGLRYAASERWGAELTATHVAAKADSDLPSDSTQFRTPSYEAFDLALWIALDERLSLQLSGWNLTDETYWQWPYARGQSQTSTTLDRYTSPGRNFGAQLRVSF